MLQPLGSHHLLLVVPRYTFIKLFLLHLRPPSHSMYIISFSRASRTSAGLLTYVVCVRASALACARAQLHVWVCFGRWEKGKGGGEVTLLFQSFRMLITPAKPNNWCVRVHAHAYRRWCWKGSRSVRRTPCWELGGTRGGREEGVACNSATSDTAAVTRESLKALCVARRWESVKTGRLKKKTNISLVCFFQTELIIQQRPPLKNRSQDADAAAQQVFNLAGRLSVGL